MRSGFRILVLMVIVVGLLACSGEEQTETVLDDAAIAAFLDKAMDPGEGQERLDFMVGEFDVTIRVWLDPTQPPIESPASAINTWVLGHRFIRTVLSGYIVGEPYDGIGYVGFNNVSEQYEATYMDSGGTGMEWFTGTMDSTGETAKMTATIDDAVTGKPTAIEMRLQIAPNGDHITELWEADRTGTMVRIIELQYTRRNS